MKDVKTCPKNYFKTKDKRCANVTVKPLISDKGLDYGVMVKLLNKNLSGYDFNEDWGLYKEKQDALEAQKSLTKELKEEGIPQDMREDIELFGG